MTKAEQTIWLAGLLEGEGSFSAYDSKHGGTTRPNLRVSVQMTDLDVVEKVAAVVPSNGKVRRVDRNYGPNEKVCYAFSWNGLDAEDVMYRILPYMGERRKAKIQEALSQSLSHQAGRGYARREAA